MAFTINGTTGIALPDGSVAAPSNRGQDADSGISYGADSIKFSTGGVERMAISNTGVTGTGVGGGVLQVKHLRKGDKLSSAAVVTDNSFTSGTEFFSLAITPSAASSYIWVSGMLHLVHAQSYAGHYWLTYNHSGISETMIAGNSDTSRRRTGRAEMGSDATTDIPLAGSLNILFHPNTTNELTIKIRAATSYAATPIYLNQTTSNSTDANDGGGPVSTLTLIEVAGSISPNITDDSAIYEGT